MPRPSLPLVPTRTKFPPTTLGRMVTVELHLVRPNGPEFCLQQQPWDAQCAHEVTLEYDPASDTVAELLHDNGTPRTVSALCNVANSVHVLAALLRVKLTGMGWSPECIAVATEPAEACGPWWHIRMIDSNVIPATRGWVWNRRCDTTIQSFLCRVQRKRLEQLQSDTTRAVMTTTTTTTASSDTAGWNGPPMITHRIDSLQDVGCVAKPAMPALMVPCSKPLPHDLSGWWSKSSVSTSSTSSTSSNTTVMSPDVKSNNESDQLDGQRPDTAAAAIALLPPTELDPLFPCLTAEQMRLQASAATNGIVISAAEQEEINKEAKAAAASLRTMVDLDREVPRANQEPWRRWRSSEWTTANLDAYFGDHFARFALVKRPKVHGATTSPAPATATATKLSSMSSTSGLSSASSLKNATIWQDPPLAQIVRVERIAHADAGWKSMRVTCRWARPYVTLSKKTQRLSLPYFANMTVHNAAVLAPNKDYAHRITAFCERFGLGDHAGSEAVNLDDAESVHWVTQRPGPSSKRKKRPAAAASHATPVAVAAIGISEDTDSADDAAQEEEDDDDEDDEDDENADAFSRLTKRWHPTATPQHVGPAPAPTSSTVVVTRGSAATAGKAKQT